MSEEAQGSVDCYIHYHEYDLNKERPILIVRGAVWSSGYHVDLDAGTLTSTCICAAYHENECTCTYDWRE